MMKQKMNILKLFFIIFIFLIIGFHSNVLAQSECMGWGNLNGIRYQGELIKFESSLCVIGASLRDVTQTAKEEQRPMYKLDGDQQIITTQIAPISFKEIVEDIDEGKTQLTIDATVQQDSSISGAFICFDLPFSDFEGAKFDFIDSTSKDLKVIPPFPGRGWRRWRRFMSMTQVFAKGIKINAPKRQLLIETDEPTIMIVQSGNPFFGSPNTRVYLGILTGEVTQGRSSQKIFTIDASGTIDNEPITMTLDPTKPGRVFDGIGGNFRLQDSENDYKVIDYCLENLNVAWGRVEMPWRFWHDNETVDPLEAARSGNLHPSVKSAMEMAQRLSKQGMPIVLSAWGAPTWAIEGDMNFRPVNGVYGNPLKKSKMRSIIKSLTAYILYLKEAYGVEATLFSFNESDLGIYVRQIGEEHRDLIKTMGAYMADQGLATKMVLGDNSDANTYEFVTPAMNDIEAHKYIGAVSFHSWRGFDNWTLSIWSDIAKEMNVPLIVGEGGVDASAHQHPDIFWQPVFALNEIDIYVRIGAICQARSILQWQLTADYSLMQGDGIFFTKGKLRPTQRFYNLKQYGLTPSGSFNMPVTSDGVNISQVAYGDIANGVYSVHIVNNGAERKVILKGLPETVKKIKIYTTDAKDRMKAGNTVVVSNGTAVFTLKSACFTSLVSSN